MKKEFFNLLPYFTFECDQKLIDELLSEIKNLSISPNSLNSSIVNRNRPRCYYNENLLDWLDDCLLEVKKELHLVDEIDLPVIACWGNKSGKMQGHHMHEHPNSFLSGILYLTTHESGYTHFIYPNIWTDKFQSFTLSSINMIEEKIKPVAGKLILFPSHVKHKVTGLVSNDYRYTIAFNVFFSGKLGKFTSDVELFTRSLRDLITNDGKKE